MDPGKTSDSYISISDDVINKSRNKLVFSGQLEESVLSELHTTWKRKMIKAGVVSGTIETPSASIPTTPVITPLQAQHPRSQSIDAQLPSTDLVLSIRNEDDGFYIPQQDGAASDGFYIPQHGGASHGDIVTTRNTYARHDEDDEILDENDDIEEDGIKIDEEMPHLIICQFDKVKKRKEKWDCKLKSGVMQINDKTILFSKAIGDFTF